MNEVAEISIWSIIYGIGLLGNVIVVFMIFYLEKYKKLTHWYILQLAVADILFLQSIPLNISEVQHQDWIHGISACRFSQTLRYVTYYASILFMTAMAIDRYLAVCKSFWKPTNALRSIKSGYIATGIIWTLSISMSIPVMMFAESVQDGSRCFCVISFPAEHKQTTCKSCHPECVPENDYTSGWEFSGEQLSGEYYTDSYFASNHSSCQAYGEEDPGMTKFAIFNFVVMFLIPLLVIGIAYVCIVTKLRKTSSKAHRLSEGNEASVSSANGPTKQHKKRPSHRSMERQKKVFALCAALVSLFVICWLPFHTVHLAKIRGISGTEKFCSNLQTVARLLAFTNSALNPFLYNFLGTFDQRLREMKKHKRTKRVLSVLGISMYTPSSSRYSGSDATKSKKSNLSSASNTNTNSQKEDIPLRPVANHTENVTK